MGEPNGGEGYPVVISRNLLVGWIEEAFEGQKR